MEIVSTVAEKFVFVEYDGQNGRDWLDQDKLEYALLNATIENSGKSRKNNKVRRQNKIEQELKLLH